MTPLPYMLDAYGPFERDQLRITWTGEHGPTDARIDALVDSTWKARTEQARRDNVLLFNGRLVRLLRHRVRNGNLLLETGPTDYAHFLATNYHNPHLGDDLGWHLFSNPIGTTATIITSDGWLAYGRRSGQVACHPGFLHALGGGLEAGELRPDNTFDGFASVLRELHEEADLKSSETEHIICLGLIRDGQIRQPELVFDVRVHLHRAQLADRIDGRARHEHESLLFCRDDSEAILPFILNTPRIAPITIGALCLHGRQRFGQAWYERVVEQLPATDTHPGA